MTITYHVGQHDGGFGYRVGGVWAGPFPDHDRALRAAKSAAARQQLGGDTVSISYQLADGRWQQENVDGGDRPDTDVVDDESPRK